MKQILRMCVVGCGFFGAKHADVIKQLPNAELVAVCDTNTAAAKAIGEKYGCNWYPNHSDMFEKEELDAVVIAVPEQYHLQPAVDAAKRGLDILLEKPIASNYKDAVRINDAAKEYGVRLMVAHVCEFDGRYHFLSNAIKEGRLGDIVSIYLKRSSTTSCAQRLDGKVKIFHYMGVHDFEAMLLFAQPALPVKAYAIQVRKKNDAFNAEDTVFCSITFDNGIIASIQLCWALPNSDALGFVACADVVGTKGASYIDIKNQGLEIHTEKGVEYPDLTYWPEFFGHVAGKVREEVQYFVNNTLSGEEYIIDTNLAIEAVRTIDACIESIQTGKAIAIER